MREANRKVPLDRYASAAPPLSPDAMRLSWRSIRIHKTVGKCPPASSCGCAAMLLRCAKLFVVLNLQTPSEMASEGEGGMPTTSSILATCRHQSFGAHGLSSR